MNCRAVGARCAMPLLLLGLVIGMTACKQKGTFEQAGEEVDEAVDALKNGKESTANKVDDAVDDVRSGFNEARDDLQRK